MNFILILFTVAVVVQATSMSNSVIQVIIQNTLDSNLKADESIYYYFNVKFIIK